MRIPKMDQVEAWKGGTLSQGRHVVEVEKVTEGTSSGGHPELEVLLRAIESDTEPGAIITDWITVTENSLGRLKQFLLACGADPDLFSEEREVSPDDLTDRTVTITVGPHQTPDRKTVQRVKSYQAD
jgi:hypothetical protein